VKVKKLEGSLKEKDREIAESRADCGKLSNSLRTTASKLVEAQKRLSEMSSRTKGTSIDALGQKLAEAESQRDRLQKNWKENARGWKNWKNVCSRKTKSSIICVENLKIFVLYWKPGRIRSAGRKRN
jgi:predicted RNase H-like nuclease (RuvC/YqgF family)